MPTSSARDGGNFSKLLCDLAKFMLFHALHAMASVAESENLPTT